MPHHALSASIRLQRELLSRSPAMGIVAARAVMRAARSTPAAPFATAATAAVAATAERAPSFAGYAPLVAQRHSGGSTESSAYAAAVTASGLMLALARSPVHADFSEANDMATGLGEVKAADMDNMLSVVESSSGQSFTTRSGELTLVGTGCRLMRQLVKVYATAIYVDHQAVRKALASHIGLPGDELLLSRSVWRRINGAADAHPGARAGPVRVVLAVVREVNGKHMASGFERALAPRTALFAAEAGSRGRDAKRSVREFCKWLVAVGRMKSGSRMEVTVHGTRVEMMIDGRWMGFVDDAALAWAVLDMYLGDDGVVDGLREDVANGLAKMLAEER